VSEGRSSPREAEELAACFRTYARDLFGHACVLTRRDRAMAEDLVQATFEAAAEAWHVPGDLTEEQRRGWLWRTLAHIAVDGFRQETAFRDRLPRIEALYQKIQADLPEQSPPGQPPPQQPPPQQAPPQQPPPQQAPREQAPRERAPREQALSSVALERCWRIIQGLPQRQHTVALLRWQLDMKESEIAQVLGIDEKTVSVYLYRVRRKLLLLVGTDHPSDGDDPEGAAP
jgi:RNA polymerase sigma factor (sigma-70 family)